MRRFPAPSARRGPIKALARYVIDEPETPAGPVVMTPAQQARQDQQCELLRRAIAAQDRPWQEDRGD